MLLRATDAAIAAAGRTARLDEEASLMLGWIAVGAYVFVSALCVFAAWSARSVGDARRARTWICIALLFFLLAVSRATNAEAQVEALLRLWLSKKGEYDARQAIQAPFAAAVIAIGGLAGLILLLNTRQAQTSAAGRATVWARRAAAVMIGLTILRVISLHATDLLLYAPLRLNWVIDLGCTVVVGASAAAFVDAVKRSRR